MYFLNLFRTKSFHFDVLAYHNRFRKSRRLHYIYPSGQGSFCKTKDELRYNYGIIRCGAALFDQLDKAEILAYRKDDYQWNVLVADKEKARRKYKNAVVDDATIDDILLLYVKGEQAK